VQQLKSTLNSPAYRLIAATALRNWLLLTVNLLSNLLGALLEGSTIGVIYLAIALISKGPDSQTLSPTLKQFLSIFPLPTEVLFVGLLGSAVVLQQCIFRQRHSRK
jgi:ATP-binding cassette, subfamily B, bacterial MsbA